MSTWRLAEEVNQRTAELVIPPTLSTTPLQECVAFLPSTMFFVSAQASTN
jgi:hypothetical protein